VFIIDKTTQLDASDSSLLGIIPGNDRGIKPGERYFAIGGIPLDPTQKGLPGADPGSVTRFAISDGLNPYGGFKEGQTIESQFVSPGSPDQPIAFNQYNAFRPEETFISGAARGDTHLLVVTDSSARNPAMRADLQIAADGRSSASVSVGGIGTIQNGGTLALSGVTVGSTQLNTSQGAIAINSNLGSLGTASDGVGAHMFGGSEKAPGQIGYFGVSQADTRLGAPGTTAGDQAGTLQAVGDPGSTTQFAFTRLATNVGTPPNLLAAGPLNSTGFVTGVVQSVNNGQGSVYAVSSVQPGDISIVSNASNTEFTATIRLSSTSVGSLASDPRAAPAPTGTPSVQVISFGSGQSVPPTTSLISPATFAAVGSGRAMASVDNDLLQGIENRTGTVSHPTTGAARECRHSSKQ
jgi:hypothetical protein